MENDKSTINKELDHIRNSINQKNETQSDDDNFILLDKIVSKGKKYDQKAIIEINLIIKLFKKKITILLKIKKLKLKVSQIILKKI